MSFFSLSVGHVKAYNAVYVGDASAARNQFQYGVEAFTVGQLHCTRGEQLQPNRGQTAGTVKRDRY